MTLEGAINLNETNDYIIYTMNSVSTGQYGVVVPKNINGTLNMLVDLHFKNSFDGIGNGTKTKEQLVNEIGEEYNKLKVKYADGMLVMPMIVEAEFQTIVANGDKQKMFDEVKKIGAITSELYKKLTESDIEKQKIDQKIIIVEKNNEDEKFVAWLKEQMPNFVDGILYSELNVQQEVVNPFTNGDNIFGTAVNQVEEQKVETPKTEEVVTGMPVIEGIFDNVAPTTPVENPVESVVTVTQKVAPVVEGVQLTPETQQTVTPVTPVEAVVNNDVFGVPVAEQSVQPVVEPVNNAAPAASVVTQVEPVVAQAQQVASVVEDPKPVEKAMLEGTIAFTPIPNHPNNPVENNAQEVVNDVEPTNNKSRGFVNLAILLVVLVGVTIASIELGKYLYSVYGA